MFSACLPSLRAVARAGDKAVRLLALRTLGEVEWKYYFGEVGAIPDLPSDMVTILDSACPIWPGRKVKDTHLLVLIPAAVDGAPFTLNLLGELVQRPKNGGHRTKYEYYGDDTKAQFGEKSPDRSYWLLMTRAVLEGSRGRVYAAQRALVVRYASSDGLPYEIPGALEAATAILMHYVCTGERLFGDSPWTYTRCQELIGSKYPVVVGCFESSGLDVNVDFSHCGSYDCLGSAGCRKF
jgi:NLR family CARD domain-containing protein 3